ncbi:hypothetical protein LENED_006090 [Lentinula edodes]|uniref:C2H2-type domain-containing protein n=1 Tax=Lentinula edodes TaxID=5353 RepID=A0A1Q3EB00_LENED|nr:hypothetical protein LENED_006090 [Lentinula edodes]
MCSEPLDISAVRQFDRKCLHVFTDEFDQHNQEVDQTVLTTTRLYELSRLRVSDDDDPAHYRDAQRRRSNDFSQRPFNVPPSRSSHPSHLPSEYFSAASHTSFSSPHTSYGREQHRPSTHLGYNSRSVTAPDHGNFTTASPVPAPNYRYPDMGVGPLSSQYSSVNPITTHDPSRGASSRSYSNYDYLTHPRVSTTLDNRNRSEEAEYALTSLAQSYPDVQPPSRDMPKGSVAPPAKYECTYCGKGFNRPNSPQQPYRGEAVSVSR